MNSAGTESCRWRCNGRHRRRDARLDAPHPAGRAVVLAPILLPPHARETLARRHRLPSPAVRSGKIDPGASPGGREASRRRPAAGRGRCPRRETGRRGVSRATATGSTRSMARGHQRGPVYRHAAPDALNRAGHGRAAHTSLTEVSGAHVGGRSQSSAMRIGRKHPGRRADDLHPRVRRSPSRVTAASPITFRCVHTCSSAALQARTSGPGPP